MTDLSMTADRKGRRMNIHIYLIFSKLDS